LYRFRGAPNGKVATGPNAGVILDSEGNLYGTTPYGGTAGMVYKLSQAGHATTLYSFPGAAGGSGPGPVMIDEPTGELYGATVAGGPANVGTVYKMDAAGKETVLYSFTGGLDGAYPTSAVVRDSAGNLYGTANLGGVANEGVVYKVDPSGHETVLHSFTDGADGGLPNGVVLDPEGSLYGTTFAGGAGSETGIQEGVVFKLDPAGQETILHSFTGLADGGAPEAGVIRDSAGNLYGTTSGGGLGAGVVYKIDAAGRYAVLHSFTGYGAGGGNPFAGVVRDSDGNLYGTAEAYGTTASGGEGAGVVFELSAAGNYAVLYTFTGYADGGGPATGVVRDAAGNLYGTTPFGGGTGCLSGCGVVFEVDPSGQETVLHTFTGGADGGGGGVLVFGPAGDLYGNAGGGVAGGGLLYKFALQ
jgi:uncharacterized repeat protein (TIGR03803 family)